MEGVFGWVSNIVYYLIFVTMLTNLLPAGKYEKYLRLFAGCILILLVIQPITGGLRLEEKITGLFNEISFENEAGELTAALADMEGKRLKALITQYETAAEEEIGRMAHSSGLEGLEVSVRIESQKDSADFGKIKQISVLLKEQNEAAADLESSVEGKEGGIVKPVEPVLIDKINKDAVASEPPSSVASAPGQAQKEEVIKLKQEIAKYYQVEAQYVEVEFKNE